MTSRTAGILPSREANVTSASQGSPLHNWGSSDRLSDMAHDFTAVGVIGLGTMGAGIVEVFARNGLDVVAVEVSPEAAEKGRGVLRHSTDRAVARGKLTEQVQASWRCSPVTAWTSWRSRCHQRQQKRAGGSCGTRPTGLLPGAS